MSSVPSHFQLQVPATLTTQLLDFRRKVWTTKMLEAVGIGAFSLSAAFLCVFALDRLYDTPFAVRCVAFVAALAGGMVAPFYLHRWIWRHRRLEHLARLLSHKMPRIGDQLLGIIELAGSPTEQARSRTLCKAAIEQVAQDAVHRDFRTAAPNSRHRLWSVLSATTVIAALFLFVVFPAAAFSSFDRFIAPWSNTPRYTFTAVEPFASTIVVPHGEAFSVVAKLNESTRRHPQRGYAKLGDQEPIVAELVDGGYQFELPAQIEPGSVKFSIGDWTQSVQTDPKMRPELNTLVATVGLPEYLGRPEPAKSDVRGGAISVVKGSQASFLATISRMLSAAQVDGQKAAPQGDSIPSSALTVDDSRALEFQWRDEYGLAGRNPFKLTITARDDEAPTLACENLPRAKVLLDTEQLAFQVKAHDDFGVKNVGMVWKGVADELVTSPAKGESPLGVGGQDQTDVQLSGTFTAKSLGIEPQEIRLRIYAEDYFPGRPRVYSAPYRLFVMNAEQHAIWITEQLSRWHRQALEVRDREMQLYETNKQLRALSTDELNSPDARRRLENQSSAEKANGRRLANLATSGTNLLREAARNPELGADNLEAWAQMLGILKDIAGNRMPSVADLLKQAAAAPSVAGSPPQAKSAPIAGQVRSTPGGGPPAKTEGEQKKLPAVPQIADAESSQQPADNKETPASDEKKKPSAGKLSFPVTTLAGKASAPPPPSNNPTEEKVDRALAEQKDLLAEFQKIADELNNLLANLEGSTLVKRLKAASRTQYKIAGGINRLLGDTFGKGAAAAPAAPKESLAQLGEQELKGSLDVSYIMDDMQAYFERRRLMAFKTVLDEMRSQDVLGSLRRVADDMKKEQGLSISQCEYWSDVLDRWAEDLVEAAGCCACKGGGSRTSVPPALVLEVLQILEGEINLREDTRVTEQAKAAAVAEEHHGKAAKLSKTQTELAERVVKVVEKLRELPNGDAEFGQEIGMLSQVNVVMNDASQILGKPDTGAPAIAAETEAIELLLRSKRINPKGGGGGGGATPGGGGTGDTTDLAIALSGSGQNDKEVREDRGVAQSLGKSGPALPEEFRAGLNEYFNRLEGRKE